MKRTILWGTALLTALAPAAGAQRTFKTIGTEIGSGLADIWWIWTSPFHTNARGWRDAALTLGATGVVAIYDDEIHAWVRNHQHTALLDAVRPAREDESPIADFGTGRRLLPLSAGLFVLGFAFDSRALRDAGVGCAAAEQANSALRHAIYEGVARRRPLTAEGDPYDIEFPGGEWELHSFFGGHAANAMACATYWSERFDLGLVEPALYTVALGIGLARMADERHWASDTMLGIIIGHAMGRTVARRQKERIDERDRRTERRPTVIDEIRAGAFAVPAGRGLAVGWGKRF
jgi:hypothetical protein